MSEIDTTLLGHLIELRTRLIKVVAAIVIVFFGLFHWAKDFGVKEDVRLAPHYEFYKERCEKKDLED